MPTGLCPVAAKPLGCVFGFVPSLLMLSDYVLDNGLNALADCDAVYICTQYPANYADVSTYSIGVKIFSGGNAFGAPQPTPDGRAATMTAIDDGTMTGTGVPVCWAAVDQANERLLLAGALNTPGYEAHPGQRFTLGAIILDWPLARARAQPSPPQPISMPQSIYVCTPGLTIFDYNLPTME